MHFEDFITEMYDAGEFMEWWYDSGTTDTQRAMANDILEREFEMREELGEELGEEIDTLEDYMETR